MSCLSGGGSVTAHLVMPKSSGLFQRAIVESGPPSDWISKPLNQSFAHTALMASQLNCSDMQGGVYSTLLVCRPVVVKLW